MALGRQGDRRSELMVGWAEMPRSPGHAFDDRLQEVLVAAGFDAFAEERCAPCDAARQGRPSLSPGRSFRMQLVGYFEGIDSERGIEWRCADSLSLREFLRLGGRERVPDHAWLSRTRARLPMEVHAAVFAWAPAKPRPDETLIRALARAHRWKRMLEEGRYRSINALAEAEKINRAYICRLLNLTLLAPDIQEAILDGRQPKGMQLEELTRRMPMAWEAQRVDITC